MYPVTLNKFPGITNPYMPQKKNVGIAHLNKPCCDTVSFKSNAVKLKPVPEMTKELMITPETIKGIGNYIAAFNPGVIDDGKGGAHMIIRGVKGENYPDPPFTSDLIYAHSKDGKKLMKKV